MNNALWMNELDRELDNSLECERVRKEIFDLAIDIYAHDMLDWEWTNGHGNGANAFEASYVAHDLLDILGLEYDKVAVQKHIRKRIKEIS